jgi:hypothetical protein
VLFFLVRLRMLVIRPMRLPGFFLFDTSDLQCIFKVSKFTAQPLAKWL